ncbi:MAG: glycosyltransferase family 39 protein [Chloroflexota bacterium]|nr:glycosyltransferase family 39 protein [Chloroflexota bacterium]
MDNQPRSPASRSRPQQAVLLVLLGLVLLSAAGLRVVGHNWDAGQRLNSDDSYVAKVATRLRVPPGSTLATLLDPQHSPLNPRIGGAFYVYGTLPLYLVRIATTVAQAVTGDPWFSGLDGVLQTGRVLAGLCDTLTALLVFAVGRRLWGAAAGLVAAALYAWAILPIQIGHFYITDPFMACAMTAVLWASIAAAQTGRRRWLAAAGLALGLALACKVSAAPVAVLPLAVVVGRGPWAVGRADGGQGSGIRGQGLGVSGRSANLTHYVSRFTFHVSRSSRLWQGLALVVGGALLGLLIGDPFALLDAGSYVKVLADQAAIQQGGIDQWFTRKYVGTPPVLYLWGQLMLLGVGPLVGVAGTLGIAAVAVRARQAEQRVEALLLLGAGAYFASIAFVEIKWVRYLLPLVPYLCLFAVALGRLRMRNAECGMRNAPGRALRFTGGHRLLVGLARGLPAALLLSAAAGGAAVSHIFRTEQTQVAASRWIAAHVPPGSRLANEVTTIALPLPLPGQPAAKDRYRLVRLDPLADAPSAVASATLRDALAKTDYLVLDTTQATRTVPRLPWRYPVQIRYYELLLSGQLGFTPVYTATSYPTLFGLAIPDDGPWVDLSFMDSSHPPIRVFQRTRPLAPAAWDALFAAAVAQPSLPTRQPPP